MSDLSGPLALRCLRGGKVSAAFTVIWKESILGMTLGATIGGASITSRKSRTPRRNQQLSGLFPEER